MLASISKQDSNLLWESALEAKEYAEEVLGADYRPCWIVWSEQLTASAGNAWHTGQIKLSAKIFRQAVLDLGIDQACVEVKKTTLHEIAHVQASGGNAQSRVGHGQQWREFCYRLDLDPDENRYHHLIARARLNQDAARWHPGDIVEFLDNGTLMKGQIIRKNVKRASVRCDGKVWLVPYPLLRNWWTHE